MKKIIFPSEYFDIKDTLECGQVFRFKPYKKGFLVFSTDKCAYCYGENGQTVIECEEKDESYFYNYFDLNRDYSSIYSDAIKKGINILISSATRGKGIRILNQDPIETLFSFIISQNNNIPRIKGIIEKLCTFLGEKKFFNGIEYFSFPTAKAMSEKTVDFFKGLSLGYRADYIHKLSVDISGGFDILKFSNLSTIELKKNLLKIHGVGPKVADCVTLFGFHRSDSFPVDTWIDKVYRENFNGTLTNREKISEWFLLEFKENAGYFQQYLFHYKRIKEKIGQEEQKGE